MWAHQQGQSAALRRARLRPLRLLGARLTAPGDATQGSVRAAGRPATASGARASRLQVAEPHWFRSPRRCPARPRRRSACCTCCAVTAQAADRAPTTGLHCRAHGRITGYMPVAGLGAHSAAQPGTSPRSPLGRPREPCTLPRGLSSAALCELQAIGALCARSCASHPRPPSRRRAS